METAQRTTLAGLSEPVEPDDRADWNDDGVVILRGAIGDELIEPYAAAWRTANGYRALSSRTWTPNLWRLEAESPGGWEYATPYMDVPELLDLCTAEPISMALAELLGEPAGLHLNLSGWVTTERNWHQDTYLNPYVTGDYYAAVWIALGDVHPDSGPFQYVPGSHRWHRLLRERIARHVNINDPMWPKQSEDFLTPLVEARLNERVERGVDPRLGVVRAGEADGTVTVDGRGVATYLPRRGDVLFWHSRLYHRGSKAKLPGAYRPALIAHYSGIGHRPDMPRAVEHGSGWFFPLGGHQPVR